MFQYLCTEEDTFVADAGSTFCKEKLNFPFADVMTYTSGNVSEWNWVIKNVFFFENVLCWIESLTLISQKNIF